MLDNVTRLDGERACHAPAGLPQGPPLSPTETTFQWLARPYALLDECAAALGETFTLQFTRFGTHVVVAHPDDVRDVLTGDRHMFHAGPANALLAPVLGKHSLLLADGDRHMEQRALLQPIFRSDRIQNYANVVAQTTARRTAAWNGGHHVNVQSTALDISKEIILRVVLGLTDADIDHYSRLIHNVMSLVGTNATFHERPDEARPSQLMERFRAARGALNDALQAHIDRRRTQANGNDVLSMLMAAETAPGNQMPDEEIRDQLVTMLLAGHETTASSITWALLCVHAQPEALAALLRELHDAGAELPAARLAALPYLEAVCLETLRLRPVIPVVSRQLQRPFRLRQWTLPAGVFVTPSPYLAHRRPAEFPEPDIFRPDRFLARRFSPYVYFPFGGGAHRCIGMSFALLELQIVLGTLMRTFRFALDGPVRPVRRAVTIVPSGGGRIYVERRAVA